MTTETDSITNEAAGASPQGHRRPSPRRVAAGRRNRALRRGLSEAGRQKLREAALRRRPWEASTGPRTAAGKARAAANGKARQKGPRGVRAVHRRLAADRALLEELRRARRLVAQLLTAEVGAG